MIEEPEEKRKSTVKHELSILDTPSPLQHITQGCILDYCEPGIKEPRRAALRIQRSIRGQYYRIIEAHPDQAYRLTYDLNCPPCGFYVQPWTRPCRHCNVCPWCFARRLLNVFNALMEPERKIRLLHRLVVWYREVPAGSELPFFRSNYGPHTWLNASVSAQSVIPYFHAATASFRLRHVGIHLTPKREMDFESRLSRSCVNPPVTSFTYNTTNPDNIYKVFNTVMRFPWLDLYLVDNRNRFEELMDLYRGQKLLRISRYRPKGAKRGH